MSMFEQDSLHLRGEFTGIFNDWQTLVGLEYRDIDLTAPHEHGDEDDDEEEEHGYLPNTESSQYGLFAFAERERNDWLTELAIRFDRSRTGSCVPRRMSKMMTMTTSRTI